MKLFLTSTVFLNEKVTLEVFNNINKSIEECRILFIPNEKANREKINSRKYIDRVIHWGFKEENIYVFDKYNPDKFKKLDIDILTIGGGNTFGTLDILRKTKFDVEIINYIKNGVIYVGGSAGSHIASANIEHVAKYDSNDVNLCNFDGLKLFGGILICHYTPERKKDYEKLLKNAIYPLYTLTDDQIIICKDDNIQLIDTEKN
jgi:peptidase E